MEAPDLPLVRDVEVAERKPGDEDREEARAVGDGREPVDDPRRGERPQRVEPLAREAHVAHEEDERAAPASPTASPIVISSANSWTTPQNEPPSEVANSSIPIMSAIPTGSFTPASPSRIVPVRPRISLSPRIENMTAGSVGRERGAQDPGRASS